MCNITQADILAGFTTDHSIVTIKVALHSNPKGLGFWKLNTSFLTETEYINQIRATIEEVQNEYRNDQSINADLLWEMIKLKVRERTIKYAKAKKAKISRKEEELERAINKLQNEIDSSSNSKNKKRSAQEESENRTRELDELIEYRTKGAILRAKCRWYNEGKKNTKYFLNLEKRHYKNGVISQLKISDKDFVTTDKEILTECETFYRNIYSSKLDCVDEQTNKLFFGDSDLTMLTSEERGKCEGLLTKADLECLNALKSMSAEKTPGNLLEGYL